MSVVRNRRFLRLTLALAAALLSPVLAANAATSLIPAYSSAPPRGPSDAPGVVVYSHGRSLTGEDSESPPPAYLQDFVKAGWDVLRFNRPSAEDTLPQSSADLAHRATQLRHKGYRRVVLTGQSFGAFLSIMAAGQSRDVDGVIATAPAAFGSFNDSYGSWRMNASELYSRLAGVRHAEIMLAFFHGDDYDPGGRAEPARSILARNGVSGLILDQPRDLVGHLAGASQQFANRYRACLVHFAEGEIDPGACEDSTPVGPSKSRRSLTNAVIAGDPAADGVKGSN